MEEIIIIKSPFIPLFQRGRQRSNHTLGQRTINLSTVPASQITGDKK
ncbi:MAG: hypothetical protein OEU95_00220 [Nitrospirota bacterium]|nr:hypothetical protein [Nitrospirota bacterium]